MADTVDYNQRICEDETMSVEELTRARVEIDHIKDLLDELKQEIKTTQKLLVGVVLATNIIFSGGSGTDAANVVGVLKGMIGF